MHHKYFYSTLKSHLVTQVNVIYSATYIKNNRSIYYLITKTNKEIIVPSNYSAVELSILIGPLVLIHILVLYLGHKCRLFTFILIYYCLYSKVYGSISREAGENESVTTSYNSVITGTRSSS